MKKQILLTLVILVLCCSAVSAQQNNTYKPELFGSLKFRFEADAYNGDSRFNIQNSRIGVRGMITNNFSYQTQIDFGAGGKVTLLDAMMGYKFGNFDLSVGQQQFHFTTEHDRGPGNLYFGNSAFTASYLTQYYSMNVAADGTVSDIQIGAIGTRDMGATLSYSLSDIPLRFMAGAFNGMGVNRSEWSGNPNFIGRIDYGYKGGFGASTSYYHGSTPAKSTITDNSGTFQYNHRIRMWAGELRYVTDNFRIESEVAQRFLSVYGSGSDRITSAMIYTLYKIELKDCMFKYIAPALRWDYIDNLKYINETTRAFENLDTHRATIGLAFGLTQKLVNAELRINYEHFLPRTKPADNSVNRTFHNKVILELVATF